MVTLPGKRPTTDEMVKFLTDFKFGVSAKGVIISAERLARTNTALPPKLAQYIQELKSLTQEQLEALYFTEVHRKAAQDKARAEADEAERFFNKPYANADFDHWSKMAYWSLDEAVALSLGKAPEKVKWKELAAHAEVSASAHNYSRRRDLTQRAVGMGQLTDGVVPVVFLRWARQNELPIPDELIQLVEKRAQTTTDLPTLLKNSQDAHAQTIANAKKEQDEIFKWAKEQQEKTLNWGKEQHSKGLEAGKSMAEHVRADMGQIVSERDQTIAELNEKIAVLQANIDHPPVAAKDVLNPKSRLSLLKLVLGMAIDGYGYDPKESKSPFAKETVDRLAALGITIDEDTVRRWLREAAEEVTHTSPIK